MYCFLKEYPEYEKFLVKNNYSLSSSILTSLSILYWLNTKKYSVVNYWEKFGYLYGGVVAYGFSKFIQNIAIEKNLDNLFFIARDGYSLQKVFDLFNTKIKTSYIYVPRLLNLIYRLDYNSNDYSQVKAIAKFYSNEFKIKTDISTIDSCNKFINDNYAQIKLKSTELYNDYKNYLQSKSYDNEKIGLVDTITINFSAQKIIEFSIDNKLWGIYWIVEKYNICNNFSEFSQYNFETLKRYYFKVWSFIEFLLSSYEYPIIGIDSLENPIIIVAMGRVFELFDLTPAIKDCENPRTLTELNNGIDFENVNFEYIPNKPILRNLNLHIVKNETLAIVGNSCGGKSTLVNLLPRFYDIKNGSIKFDGVDIREYSLDSLRENISMVFQDNFLCSGTIKDNIMMGKSKCVCRRTSASD